MKWIHDSLLIYFVKTYDFAEIDKKSSKTWRIILLFGISILIVVYDKSGNFWFIEWIEDCFKIRLINLD